MALIPGMAHTWKLTHRVSAGESGPKRAEWSIFSSFPRLDFTPFFANFYFSAAWGLWFFRERGDCWTDKVFAITRHSWFNRRPKLVDSLRLIVDYTAVPRMIFKNNRDIFCTRVTSNKSPIKLGETSRNFSYDSKTIFHFDALPVELSLRGLRSYVISTDGGSLVLDAIRD